MLHPNHSKSKWTKSKAESPQEYLDFHRSARAKLLEQATKRGYKGQGQQSFSAVGPVFVDDLLRELYLSDCSKNARIRVSQPVQVKLFFSQRSTAYCAVHVCMGVMGNESWGP